MFKLDAEGLEYFEDYFGIEFKPLPKIDHVKNPLKRLTLSDIHAPFHNAGLLNKAIDDNLDSKDVNVLGDWCDFYSRSRWTKKVDIDVRREFREAYYILQRLAQNFDTVNLMITNHDDRIIKYIYNNVTPDCLPFIHTGILEELISYIPNIKIQKQKVNHNREVGYVWQQDNVINTHIEKSSTDIGKTVIEISKLLMKWQNTYNLKPYNIIIQAHNHCSAKIKINENLWLFQIPCLIDISEPAFNYVFDGTMKGNPPALGYIIEILNDDGTVNPKETHIVDL